MSERIPISVRPASIEEAQQFMMDSSQTMDGGRNDLDSRGITSDDPTMRREIRGEPSTEPPYVQQQPQEQDFRVLYGREANEKGQWRRTAEEALAQLELLKAQMASPQMGPGVQGTVAPQTQGNYSYVPPAITAPQPPPIPERFFPNLQPQEPIMVEDVERMLKEMVAPEIWNLRLQNQALQNAQVSNLKLGAGITPVVENQLVSTHPWLASVNDPFARVAAMQELVRGRQQAQPVQQQAQTQGQAQGTPNRAVQRATFTERMEPRTSDVDMDANALFQREMAEAMQKPFGTERTEAMRAVFYKYGVRQGNDFGPGVLTR